MICHFNVTESDVGTAPTLTRDVVGMWCVMVWDSLFFRETEREALKLVEVLRKREQDGGR